MSEDISIHDVEELLRGVAEGYSKKLASEDLTEEQARLLTVFCLDLVNLLHFIHGDIQKIIENQEKYGKISAIQIEPMADYQAKQAEQEAETLAKDPDPLKWN